MKRQDKVALCWGLINEYSVTPYFVESCIDLFKKHRVLLKNTKITFSHDNGKKIFNDINIKLSNPKLFVQSNYKDDKMLCLTTKGLKKKKFNINIDRNINFDSNIVSFITQMYDEKQTPLDIDDVRNLLTTPGVSYTFFPYLLENCLFKNCIPEIVKENVRKFERVFWNTKKSEKECDEYANLLIEEFERLKGTEQLEDWKKLYKQIYICVLLMYKINCEKISKDKKIIKFINEYLEQVKIVMVPEFNVAQLFFCKNYGLRLFRNLQHPKDVIKELKNISWDLFDLRYADVFSVPSFENSILVEALLTYDNGIKEIRDCYSYKGRLISDIMPNMNYYDNQIPDKLYSKINRLHDVNRIEEAKSVNYDKIIKYYESKITRL